MIRYFLAAAIFAAYGAVSFYLGNDYGAETVQAKWDTEKASIVTAQRDKEALLQANMDKLRTEKNNELARLNRHVRTLSDSLRNRPERPAVPEVASAGDAAAGCTGARLYKPDGEFLVGESSRADQLKLALITCQDAYQAASKQTLEH